jgi:hypothetical protein
MAKYPHENTPLPLKTWAMNHARYNLKRAVRWLPELVSCRQFDE